VQYEVFFNQTAPARGADRQAIGQRLAPVVTLRGCSVIFGTLIGAVLLKERFGARGTAASSLVAAGFVALAAGALH
jgi:drug/metabolite transporter (DMT)-like permease